MTASFTLTTQTRTLGAGLDAYRIRALRRIPATEWSEAVEPGELGGWVQSERVNDSSSPRFGQLRISDDAWVGGNATLSGNAAVDERGRVEGRAVITDDAHVGGTTLIDGRVRVTGSADVRGFAQVHDNSVIGEDALVRGDAYVSGFARINGRALIDTDIYIGARTHISGDAAIFRPGHLLYAEPLGPRHVAATLYRTADSGNELQFFTTRSWVGPISRLAAHAEAESSTWQVGEDSRDFLVRQIRAFADLALLTSSGWAAE